MGATWVDDGWWLPSSTEFLILVLQVPIYFCHSLAVYVACVPNKSTDYGAFKQQKIGIAWVWVATGRWT